MIDWIRVLLHVCWIVGASLLLAEYSYRSWEKQENTPVNDEALKKRTVWEVVAVIMVGFGLTMTADTWLHRILWIVVALLLLGQIYLRNNASSTHPNE